LSYVYVYFKPSIYASNSIIKVKANEKEQTEDIINNTLLTSRSKDVLEEISLLKTYKINDKALDYINLKVRFFIDDGYKRSEIYGKDVPISIQDIKVLDPKIIGKTLTLVPNNNQSGYSIHYKIPYKAKLRQKLFNTNEFKLEESGTVNFNQKYQNKYVKFKINRNKEITQPIHFTINGEKRDIFESLISPRLTVTQLEKDTSLIKITFEDTIPERANIYVDALTKSFIDYSVESKNTQNNETLKFITAELENIKKELKRSEDSLELHQVTTNIVKPSVQASLYIKNLSEIEIEIAENNLKKKLISNLITFVKNNYNLHAIAPSVEKLNAQNTLALITKLQNMQIEEEELTQEYTDAYPKLQTLRKKIQTIRNKIEFNLNSLRTNIEYENNSLINRKKSYEHDMKTLPAKERKLVNIKRNYEVKSKMYEYLLKKQAENKIIQLATFSDYQVIDKAYSTNIPIKPRRFLIIVLSTFLGLILGIIIAFLRHTKNNYIKGKEDIENLTSLPFYGSIPYHKQKKHTISIHKELKSPFSEGFRTLRTNLQFISNKNEGTIMLITSTVAGEGKSTIAANLATIMEMAKYKTVVVNFDLRKPTLHKFFDIDNSKGISTYLSGEDTLHDIISATEFANLDIISSGPIPSNPSELILSKELPKLFKELKETYEYIIVDTAPIGIISDTKTLMQYSDLNLIIIREDYAKKEFILTLEDIIEKHNFEKVGVVLNASKAQKGEYGYGYSYEYKY
ncbi:MAG TPA: polysaccharide biosynthesis tyrosine autokinase, partial [Arcobacter sp.]|nr:polysaccharide biosynthesis tyrosine autokinase [Arcobacter sp.]